MGLETVSVGNKDSYTRGNGQTTCTTAARAPVVPAPQAPPCLPPATPQKEANQKSSPGCRSLTSLNCSSSPSAASPNPSRIPASSHIYTTSSAHYKLLPIRVQLRYHDKPDYLSLFSRFPSSLHPCHGLVLQIGWVESPVLLSDSSCPLFRTSVSVSRRVYRR